MAFFACFLLCVRVRACVYEFGVCVFRGEGKKKKNCFSDAKTFPTAAGGQAADREQKTEYSQTKNSV